MKICFSTQELKETYETWKNKKYSLDLIKSYIKKTILIQEAENENDLRKYKSLHFEKMQWSDGEYSIRLNDQYRLIFEIQKDWNIKIIFIKQISKHYE